MFGGQGGRIMMMKVVSWSVREKERNNTVFKIFILHCFIGSQLCGRWDDVDLHV
jgi:hypothetical protein